MKAIITDIREMFKDISKTCKEMYIFFWRLLVTGFWKVSTSKTFILAMLIGFLASFFFHFFLVEVAYFLSAFLAFIMVIYLFVKIYRKAKERFIQEEKERIERLYQKVDYTKRRNQYE
ncbi:MAG: hypothetical protein NZ826_02300 [Thermodesulfovibrio sp.]|nr:hypothetical protein [Thermodesulfovibrio sp.]MDW7972427.1 hypothetical protein [Thermodesulfovibrio sp.]